MAERKLDIDAPLLSVRRFSMKSSSSKEEDEKVFGNSMPNRRHNVLDQVTEPVAVPFLWEQIPGRRKDGNEPAPELVVKAAVAPRLPPGRVLDAVGRHSGFKALPLTENITKLTRYEEGMDEEEGGDDEDDSFSNAIGMLAMPEAFSMTCSVSGLSNADVKPSGTFSTDAETRDFIMSRFLPAARAMTLQLTQNASKKQPTSPQEPTQDNIMVVSVRRPHSPIKCGDLSIPHYCQDKEVKSEVQCRDEKHNDTSPISAKGCGLFARICLKSHLRLLNPVKAALIHTHSETIKKAVTSNQNVLYKHKSGELPKLAQKDGFYKHNSGELPKLTQEMTGGSKRVSYSGNLQTMGRLSPTRRSGVISSYQREATQSPFCEAGFKSNQSNSIKRAKQGSSSITPAVEKTLYVDTVSTAEILSPNLRFSDAKEQMGYADGSSETISEISSEDIECMKIVKGLGILNPTVLGSSGGDLSSLPKGEAGMMSVDEGRNQEMELLECTKKPNDAYQNPKVDSVAVKVGGVQSPLPPPLPKPPSESWLWRTLPTVNAQNSHSRTQFPRRKQDVLKHSPPITKWETIVKTSNPCHDHSRYSQALLVHPYKT